MNGKKRVRRYLWNYSICDLYMKEKAIQSLFSGKRRTVRGVPESKEYERVRRPRPHSLGKGKRTKEEATQN